jgi:hypothetical protein
MHLELIAFLCVFIEHEFKAPRKLISFAKSVAESKDVCAAPDQRLKKQFDPEKKNTISRFYHSPEHS